MAVDLDSGTGLMDRLGKLKHLHNQINSHIGDESTVGTWPKELKDALVLYDGETLDVRSTVDDLLVQLERAQSSVGSFKESCRAAAEDTLITMVNADNPLPTLSTDDAISELIIQMNTSSDTVDAAEPTATLFLGGITDGDGTALVTIKNGRGQTMQNILAEDVEVKVTSTTTAGREKFLASGESVTTDKLDHRWPAGSGASKLLTAVDAAASSPTLLTNGSFDAFTANDPDSWTIDVGAAGTDVLENVTNQLKGTSALELVGDGATLVAISQDLSAAGLKSRTNYGVCCFLRVSAASPAAGVLQIDLYDGLAIIDDDEGTANSFTQSLPAVGVTYIAIKSAFRLPEPPPELIQLRVHLTTAISNTFSAYIDQLSLVPMTQLIDGGPYLNVFSGGANFSLDDTFRLTVANTRVGAIQEMFDVFFDMVSLDQLLPSATGGAETISDGVIG